MKNFGLSILVLFSTLNAFAQDDTARAETHTNKARVLIEQKEWKAAGDEARKATQLNSQSADAWLILGTIEMRLENNSEALEAFNKYLALSPPADKAAAVKQRVAELEVRLDKQRKEQEAKAAADAKAKAERFGPGGSGFFIGFSPSYQPALAGSGDLNSSISSSFDFGFRYRMVDIGLKFASGNVDRITVKDEDDAVLRTERGGKHNLTEFFVNVNIPASTPPDGKAGVQFLVPLKFGMYMNNVKFPVKTYWNMGMDLGVGGQLRYYTGSHFSFDITGLYTLALPITAVQNNDAKIETVYNAEGKKAAGSLNGLDLRAGITILF